MDIICVVATCNNRQMNLRDYVAIFQWETKTVRVESNFEEISKAHVKKTCDNFLCYT